MSPQLQKLKDLLKVANEGLSRADFTASFKLAMEFLAKSELKLAEKINARLAQIRNGADGHTPTKSELQTIIRPLIPKPLKGDKGDPGTTYTIFGKSEQGLPGKDGSPDTPVEVRDKLETLEGDERLDKSAIKGIDQIEANIKKIEIRPTGNIVGARGIGLYVDGSKKLLTAQTLNLIAGAGITLSYAYANGRNDVTITSTGSASPTPIVVTGTVDDSNLSFTAASTPNVVVVNGNAYRDGHGVIIVGLAITLDSPVGNGGDIYGL